MMLLFASIYNLKELLPQRIIDGVRERSEQVGKERKGLGNSFPIIKGHFIFFGGYRLVRPLKSVPLGQGNCVCVKG